MCLVEYLIHLFVGFCSAMACFDRPKTGVGKLDVLPVMALNSIDILQLIHPQVLGYFQNCLLTRRHSVSMEFVRICFDAWRDTMLSRSMFSSLCETVGLVVALKINQNMEK